MNSILRFSLLLACGAAGVGLAIYLATASLPGSSPAVVQAEPAPADNAPAIESVAPTATDDPTADDAAKPAAPVARIAPRPPVAQLASPNPQGDDMLRQVIQAIDTLKDRVPKTPVDSSDPLPAAPPLPSAVAPQPVSPTPAAPPTDNVTPVKPRVEFKRNDRDGRELVSMSIQGADIRGVLELLSEQGNLNILASNNVAGTVSASLKDVNVETALDAILRSTGFIWRQEGEFIYVGTQADLVTMKQAHDHIATRLYRLNYVKAADLQTLVTPILTPEVGTISISAPAEVGIGADPNTAGGDGFAGQEAILVRDYEAVLQQVDQIVDQIDCRPTQVQIEAMILSVRLKDDNALGVDFSWLQDNGHLRITSGSPLANIANLQVDKGGLKVGFLDSNLGMFVNALESIGDTNVIATPRLMCLNKHRAQILIGSQLGYVSTTQTETSTTQSVEFLEVGTQLRIRPFIASDGSVRLEVHPELSTGNVRVEGGFTLPDKEVTEVTTNVVVRDGSTVILGGLMRDELANTSTQIPWLGSMPLVGPLFRQTSETTERREILVLITPRIVYDAQSSNEGNAAAAEFHHRHQIYADKLNPLGTRYIGRKYFRLAQNAWAAGRQRQALRLINLSIHFDPMNRAAIDLRADIWASNPDGDYTIPAPFRQIPPGSPIDGDKISPWLLQRLEAGPAEGLNHPLDRGRPGERHDIYDPNQVQ